MKLDDGGRGSGRRLVHTVLRLLAGAATAVTLVTTGCGDDDGAPADAGPDAEVDPAPRFERSTALAGVTSGRLRATFRDEPDPDGYQLVAEEGACRQFTSDSPFCVEPCEPDGLCTATDVCTPFPVGRSAGTLTVSAGDVTREIEPIADGVYDDYFGAKLFAPGDVVTVSASGGALGAFELSGELPSPPVLDTTGPGALPFVSGEPYVLRWAPESSSARVRAELFTDRSTHGFFHPVLVVCEGPDTGALELPAAMVDALLDPTNWGCGICAASTLARYRSAVADVGDTEVELIVSDITVVDVFAPDDEP